MRIRTTDCCLTQKGSGIVVMQEQLNQNECQILIYSVQDFLARHSLSPESEKDLLTQEELSFLKLPGFLKLKDPRILSLKMFPVCYRMTKAGRFAPSSVRFLNWGTMSNGKCLTARISESPKQENGCILSDILISDVPEKYYLNQKQMEQLLFKSGQEVREKESTVPKDYSSTNDIYRVQMPNITPHVCQHTYCSNMAKSGMNPKTLQYLMGHSDISVTMNVYTHIGFDDALV